MCYGDKYVQTVRLMNPDILVLLAPVFLYEQVFGNQKENNAVKGTLERAPTIE